MTADDGAFFVRERGVKMEIRLAVLAAEIAISRDKFERLNKCQAVVFLLFEVV